MTEPHQSCNSLHSAGLSPDYQTPIAFKADTHDIARRMAHGRVLEKERIDYAYHADLDNYDMSNFRDIVRLMVILI